MVAIEERIKIIQKAFMSQNDICRILGVGKKKAKLLTKQFLKDIGKTVNNLPVKNKIPTVMFLKWANFEIESALQLFMVLNNCNKS